MGHKSTIQRRNFIKLSTLSVMAFNPIVSTLSNLLKLDEESLAKAFDDEFHYFGNNLANLHFYFINAKINGYWLNKVDESSTGYMVVRLPQQHISEELLSPKDFSDQYEKNPDKRTKSYISGFSFLAFKLFPKAGQPGGKRSLNIEDRILEWHNEMYFELIVPDASDYRQIITRDGKNNIDVSQAIIKDEVDTPGEDYIANLYRSICDALFVKSRFPVTVLEIPEKLLVTPYASSGKKAYVDTYAIGKKRYLFDKDSKRVTRTVEEIWSAQMFFNTLSKQVNPSLRGAGLIPRKDTSKKLPPNECPEEKVEFLPTLLDKEELLYLTSLGKIGQPNKDDEWNIETKGLVFTGLGAIAKLHYKNFVAPSGIDLVEYEHHITLGRDEYIKVARIGVISATGQKALHVKIGQRKIVNGVSYMEFRQYIEIIQKEITYFDETLFIKGDLNKKEPNNYIQVRKNYSTGEKIHSYDDIYGQSNTQDDNDVWFDKKLWSFAYDTDNPYLPSNWNTHFKRWPFVKVKSVTFVTAPINPDHPDAFAYADPSCNCSGFFWPVKEDFSEKEKDAYLEFTGYDWNGNEIRFSSTFLFIRKTLIECLQDKPDIMDAMFSAPKTGFMHQEFERRHIRFVDQKIAFTPDYTKTGTGNLELPNRSNIAKTDYLEYYFSLCREKDGKLLKIIDGKVELGDIFLTITNKETDTIFNMREFPLFPQMKRSQIYPESLPEELPAIVEYNDDYVYYGFERTKILEGENQPPIEILYNKAKLIFNQNERFMKGRDNVLELIDGKWVAAAEAGYDKIRQAYSAGGAAVGALVNPDFDLQCIGLVKQSIAIGKEFNEKYRDVTEFVAKIQSYTPTDLFRQLPEIFKGINISAVLEAVFPAIEAPVNEVKNVLGQIEKLGNEITNNQFYQMVRSQFDVINREIELYPSKLEALQQTIDKYLDNAKLLKDIYDQSYHIDHYEKLVKNKIEEFKTGLLQYDPDIDLPKLNATAEALANEIFTSFCVKVESVYPYYQVVKDTITAAKKIREFKTEDGKTFSSAATVVIDNWITVIEKHNYIFIDINATATEGVLFTRNVIVKNIEEKLVNPLLSPYLNYFNASREEYDMRLKLRRNEITQNAYTTYYNTLQVAKATYDNAFAQFNQSALPNLFKQLKALEDAGDKIIVAYLENEIAKLQSDVSQIFESLTKFGIATILETYHKAAKEYKNLLERIKCQNGELELIKSKIEKIDDLQALVKKTNEKVYEFSKDFDTYKKDIGTLSRAGKPYIEAYNYITGDFFWNGLKQSDKVQKEIMKTLGITTDIDYKFREFITPIIERAEKIKDDVKARITELKNTEVTFVSELNQLKKDIADIENKIRERANDEIGGIINTVKNKIEEYRKLAESNPEVQKYAIIYAQGKALYRLLTSISQKETNYTWQTQSFKSADFGIVSFIASDQPKTSLTVDVRSTIYFQPNQFPPVICRVESLAKNKLTNFGISLFKAVIVNFNEVSFVAATNQKPKFEVKVRDVQFAGAFSFVQALESLFKDLLGDNFKIAINPQSVSIEYLLYVPYIGAPSFGFKDVTFRIAYMLYFQSKPMELGVGIGTPENRTKLSVGIYTGLFYLFMLGNPKQGITTIEVSIEFGGYFGLSLGPLRGEVKLVVGLYYKKDFSGVVIEGYFLCEGNVKLWFVMITARFYMGVRSQGNYVEGRCTVSYEISLGRFFKKSFSATYYKKLAGASPGNSQQNSLQSTAKANSAAILATSPRGVRNNARNDIRAIDVAVHKKIVAMIDSHPVERNLKPLTLDDWKMFINTYNE